MCGRGTQAMTWRQVHEKLSLVPSHRVLDLQPRYNIAPTTDISIVRETDGGRVVETARWDLVPSWWKKPLKDKTFSTYNARAETITQTASFRTAWRKGRRCIVPMTFYEWNRPRKKGEAPYYIYPAHESFFRLAGIWDEWADPETGEVILSCAVITCAPNAFMAKLHDRMPVILGADQADAWFNAPPEEALEMLKACPSDWMNAHRVSPYVNNARNQGPECIERAE